MCKFKFEMGSQVWVKSPDLGFNLAELVTINGRRDENGVEYKVTNGKVSAWVSCKALSNRPPFQEIYVVYAEVHNSYRRRNPELEYEHYQVIVGDEQRAIKEWEYALMKCHCTTQYAGRYGKCILYTPKIHDDGKLSQFPEDDEIIKSEYFC